MKEDGKECKWCREGFEDGDHIVFWCEEMWRPKAKLGGSMKEWDLVEEFFSQIQDPY